MLTLTAWPFMLKGKWTQHGRKPEDLMWNHLAVERVFVRNLQENTSHWKSRQSRHGILKSDVDMKDKGLCFPDWDGPVREG